MTDAGTSEEVVLGHPLPTISDQFMQERLTTVKSFTAVLLRTTASFSPDARPIVWEHGRRNFALMEAGIAAWCCRPPTTPTGPDCTSSPSARTRFGR
jgi:hypothetical protein